MNICDASRITGGGDVKQADDVYTLDLIDKPKRGRPRKPDALTPAQRAQRYRDKVRGRKGPSSEAVNAAMNRAAEWYARTYLNPALQGFNKPEPVQQTPYFCTQCGSNVVNAPRMSCSACWPFPGFANSGA